MSFSVLVADESPSLKRVFHLALEDMAEVRAVYSGDEVFFAVKNFPPQIVFLDLLLSKKNAYDICHELKEHFPDLPVVLMWTSFVPLNEEKFQICKADDHLKKPFDMKQIRQLVQKYVKPKELHITSSEEMDLFPELPEFEDATPSPQDEFKVISKTPRLTESKQSPSEELKWDSKSLLDMMDKKTFFEKAVADKTQSGPEHQHDKTKEAQQKETHPHGHHHVTSEPLSPQPEKEHFNKPDSVSESSSSATQEISNKPSHQDSPVDPLTKREAPSLKQTKKVLEDVSSSFEDFEEIPLGLEESVEKRQPRPFYPEASKVDSFEEEKRPMEPHPPLSTQPANPSETGPLKTQALPSAITPELEERILKIAHERIQKVVEEWVPRVAEALIKKEIDRLLLQEDKRLPEKH